MVKHQNASIFLRGQQQFIFIYMATELTEEEKLAAEKAAAEKGEVIITDEIFQEEFKKRLGAAPEEFIKKTDILSPEQQAEVEKKKKADALSWAISSNYITPEELEAYNKAQGSDNIDLARKKFIALLPDDKEAGKLFDKMIKLDEADELEDGETKVTNTEKQRRIAFAKKLAEEELQNGTGKKIASIGKRYEQYLESQALVSGNEILIKKAVAEIPKRLEIEIDVDDKGTKEKFGIDLSPEDIAAAEKLVLEGNSNKKGVKPEDVKLAAGSFLMAKNVMRLVAETRRIAYANGVADQKRGAANIDKEKEGEIVVSGKRKALIKTGIIPQKT